MSSRNVIFEEPLSSSDPNGIVGQGGSLEAPLLIEAYSRGVFPWPQKDGSLLWISPIKRGVLDFSYFKIPKSLKKEAAVSEWSITFNKAFPEVIQNCQAVNRKGQTFTWITDNIISAYTDLHKLGFAHSVECWAGDELIGGLYGVWNGKVFTGESMFFKKPSASKFALLALIDALKQNGIHWIDIQIVSNYMGTIGGKLIEREEFYSRIETIPNNLKPSWPASATPKELIERASRS